MKNSKNITRRSFIEKTGTVAGSLTIIPGSFVSGFGYKFQSDLIDNDFIGSGGMKNCPMWTMRKPFTLFSEKDGQVLAPKVFKLPCGDLILTSKRDGDYPFTRSLMLRSIDSGSTWQEEDLHNDYMPTKTVHMMDNDIVRIYNSIMVEVKDSSKEEYLFFYCDSNDGGKTFSRIKTGYYELSPHEQPGRPIRETLYWGVHLDKVILLREILEAAGWHQKDWHHGKNWFEVKILRFPTIGKIRLADDSLLAFKSTRIGKDQEGVGGSMNAYISRDNGITWEFYTVVAQYEVGNFPYEGAKHTEHIMSWDHQYGEESVVTLRDGRIYMVMRAGGAGFPIVQTWSADNGKSWTPVKPIDRRVVGVSPTVIKLTDGTLAMCYGRPGMYVMFDPSGTGENWQVDNRFDLTDGEALTLRTNARPFINRPDIYDNVYRIKGLLSEGELDWVKPEILNGYWYSWENVDMCEVESGRLFVVYDLQNWIEAPGATHRNAHRGVRFDYC
jgi:hypothetical protein